jgi:hypothetical protein
VSIGTYCLVWTSVLQKGSVKDLERSYLTRRWFPAVVAFARTAEYRWIIRLVGIASFAMAGVLIAAYIFRIE